MMTQNSVCKFLLMIIILLLTGHYNALPQGHAPKPPVSVRYYELDQIYTKDSISFFDKTTRQLLHGLYTINHSFTITNSIDDDRIIKAKGSNGYSRGSFIKGRKNGTWTYYNKRHKISEEVYHNGCLQRVKRFNTPLK